MNRFRFGIAILAACLLLTINSCVRKEYDAPPDTQLIDPKLLVNMTIAQLKVLMASATLGKRIDSNWIIEGIVNADDRSGNFYKQINIADTTGGISVLVDGNSLYTRYPIGRKVYIKLQGLYYGFYNKLPQIGNEPDFSGSLSNIPFSSADKFIVRANFPNPVAIDTFSGLAALKAVNAQFVQRFVRIDNVEIVPADTLKTYAQPAAITSGTSINIQDCNGNKIAMRTSGYASFQGLALPKGRGSITAIYTNFGTTPQLVIRDTSDLKFYGPRCGSGPVGPSTAPLITIDSVRKSYPGSGNYTMPASKITGVVISDVDSKNVSTGNFIFQDNSGRGVILYLAGSTAYKLGDSLEVELTGAVLKLYNGSMEVDGLTAAKINKIASGKSVTPLTVTIADLNANMAKYESTMLKIVSASVAGGGTFSGNKDLSDASGQIVLRTANTATFATSNVPTSPKTFIGYPLFFNATKQFNIRNLNDVQ